MFDLFQSEKLREPLASKWCYLARKIKCFTGENGAEMETDYRILTRVNLFFCFFGTDDYAIKTRS